MKLSPQKARKYSDILKLANTIKTTSGSWMHLCHNGRIAIVNQKHGRNSMGIISLTRGEFEQFVSFYKRGQAVATPEEGKRMTNDSKRTRITDSASRSKG